MAKRRHPLIKKYFLDSSVLFTAVNSVTGGSAKLFAQTDIKLYVSKLVLTETERNVRDKLQSYHLDRFLKLVEKLEIIDIKPDPKLIILAKKVIVEKDAAILSQAKDAKTDLITLDKRHFLTDKAKNFLKPHKILTPKMFFRSKPR